MNQDNAYHIRHVESLRAGFLGLFLAALGLSFETGSGPWKYFAISSFGILGALYSLRVQATLNVLWANSRKNIRPGLDPDSPNDVKKAGEKRHWVERVGGNLGVYVPTLLIFLSAYVLGITWGIWNLWCMMSWCG